MIELDKEIPELDKEIPDLDKCAGLILAAGQGIRFKGETNKLLASYKGKPLVCSAVESALAAGFGDVYVVMGAVDLNPILPDGIILVENESWKMGQGCSLNVGITCARNDGYKTVVVGLGDAPLVLPSAWQEVAQTPGLIVTATHGGRRSPPVKLEAQIWSLLPISGDEGARALMAKRPDLVVEVECEGDFRDVDTQEDLKHI